MRTHQKRLITWLSGLTVGTMALTASCSPAELAFTQGPPLNNSVQAAAVARSGNPAARSTGSALAQANPLRSGRTWQDEIVYFVFTDRFANGDRNNDFNVSSSDPWAYHGGDLQGIINKLDYLKDLGATALWITPVIDNRDEVFMADFGGGKMQGIWGYHGYWFKDFYKIDEHLGSMAKMKELVQQAHQRGIKILLDVVANHTDYDHPYAKDRKNPQSPYHGWFNHYGVIKNFDDQWWVENGELAELPDLNQNNPAAAKYVIDSMKWWAQQTGVDGFRIDTVKHVYRPFWQQFNQAMHQHSGNQFMLLGEIYDGRPEFMANYLNEGMDSAFDFPLYYAIKDAFGHGQSMRRLGEVFGKDGVYANAQMLSPFIDNHDVPRFLHSAGPDGRRNLMQAMALIMTIRGFPTLYYGTEVGLPGGPDPDNRRDMDFNRDPELRQYLKQLIQIRKNQRALRRGRQLEMWQDNDVYAFTRLTEVPQEEVICAFNNREQPQTRTIPLRQESPLKGTQTQLTNLLNPQDQVTIQNGSIQIRIPPKSVVIYRVTSRTR